MQWCTSPAFPQLPSSFEHQHFVQSKMMLFVSYLDPTVARLHGYGSCNHKVAAKAVDSLDLPAVGRLL